MFSRREFVKTGAVAGAAALLLPKLGGVAYAASGDPSQLFSIRQASDPHFSEQLEKLFPGLLNDPIFGRIKTHAVLITNISGRNIRAHSTVWSATTPDGPFTATRLHLFHPNTKRPTLLSHFGKKGNKTRFSGKIPVLKVGATRLITPYFNWSPRYYAKNKQRLDWDTLLNAKASRTLFYRKLSNATSIQVSVDAAVLSSRQIVGPDSGHLAKLFRKSRNGEHDEALSILRLVQAGSSKKVIASTLKEHFTLPFTATASSSSDPTYLAARKRLAKVLYLRLKHGKPAQFERTLKYIAKQPKTTVGLRPSIKVSSAQAGSKGDVA